MKRIRARILALLAALIVALPLVAAGGQHYFCRAMGRVMDKCCCPSKADTAATLDRAGCPPRVEKQDCCVKVDGGSTASAPGLRDNGPRIEGLLLATIASLHSTLPEPERGIRLTSPVQARAPPPTGPPLFLKNCALLT